MARKRMIDPNIWEDPEFASLSRDARLLFIGFISNADDKGYLRGHSGSLKRLIFGFDDDMSADAIQMLRNEVASKIRNVHIFEVDGQEYIHLNRWDKYQKQQKDRIQESNFPLCSICLASDKQVHTEVKLSKVNVIVKKEISKERKEIPQRYGSVDSITLEDMEEIAEKYGASVNLVRFNYEKLKNYCGAKGKTYRNYKMALSNWVLEEMKKQAEHGQGRGSIDAKNL